ncbi:MAG: bifunctional folylpolyglutamate synthase/dihydrofolate synthase [Nitrospirae bacterium]|nr:bifunctional folylpolyglutamate synthase/dihydrofolate synthase [Nitrospirota bacterium]
MSYSETIHYLYSLQKYGIKFGLDNIDRLLSALGKPHKSFPSIHVAGTNGKGSTSAIIASILKSAGLKVGLVTSPHLVSFTERIRINGEEITEKEVIDLIDEVREIVIHSGDFSPTFFEVVTAIALEYFKRKKIDVAVIEVGMGGRLDATNIIIPAVSVITNISYDHMKFLGNTLRDIATEKAGIIKDEVPVVISSQVHEVLEVIEAKAKEKNAEKYLYGRDFSSVLKKEDLTGIYFDYLNKGSLSINDLHLPLIGKHQLQNVSVAIKTVELLSKKLTYLFSFSISHFIRDGLSSVKWEGRLEIIKEDPPIVIDGAHNPAAAEAISDALKKNFLGKYKKVILVLGIMGDKNIEGIMKPLLPLSSEIILTSPDYERAASPERLAGIAVSLGFHDFRIASTVKDAIEMAINDSYKLEENENSKLKTQDSKLNSSLIVITGSFYTIGEAKEVIGQKGVLTRLRE